MIDLHAHLLPGVDDGARSLDEAISLARLAVEDGTSVVVVTPHAGGRDAAAPAARLTAAQVQRWTAALQAELDAARLPLRLVPGMEVFVEAALFERLSQSDQTDRLPVLGQSRYVLLELPPHALPPRLPDLLFHLQAAGYVPLIAHPERNAAMVEQPHLLYEMVARGCLAQVTAMSLTGAFGPRVQAAAELLLEHELVHVIASDAHWFPERPTGLSTAVARAAALIGEEQARAMVTTVPRGVLENQPPESFGFTPRVPQQRRRWWPWSALRRPTRAGQAAVESRPA